MTSLYFQQILAAAACNAGLLSIEEFLEIYFQSTSGETPIGADEIDLQELFVEHESLEGIASAA